ncbi:MAG: hypothetical protein IPH09_15665 [bacterium]|nr:hypothetical protein [bacterium]
MKPIALLMSVMLMATGSVDAQSLAVGRQAAAPTADPVAADALREVTAAAAPS